jgi:hypothetical protein
VYIHLLGVQCLVSPSDGLAKYAFPLYNTLVVQKPPAASTEPVHAPGPLDIARNQANPCAMLNAGWRTLLAALTFLLTLKLSDSIFGDI